MKLFKNRNLRLDLILLLIAATIIFIWFKQKLLFAAAEEGMPLYNPTRTLNLFKSIWVEEQLGYSLPFLTPRLPYIGFASLLQFLGLESWFAQAVIFFILLITPLLTMPRLLTVFFPKTDWKIRLVASLFYVLNLFTLSQVWMRFIYALMFVWSFLPLFLLIWIRWINERRCKYLVFFILSNFVFSGAFGLTASVFTLWIPAGLFSLNKLLRSKDKVTVVTTTLIGMIVWLIFNIWWIYPLYQLRNNSFSPLLSSVKNFSSLLEVSKYYPNRETMLLRQAYWFGEKNPLFDFYNQSYVYSISVLFFIITILGFVSSRKTRHWKYLAFIFIVSWFIVKGTNAPLGKFFYKNVFEYFPHLQVIRNPYEKLGSIWLLSYAIFFSLGVYYILKRIRGNFNVFVFGLLMVVYGFLNLPLINGEVFYNYGSRVPEYYQEVDNYVKNTSTARIFHLPYLRFDQASYGWGYQGGDLSKFLIENRSVSRALSYPLNGDFYQAILRNIKSEYFTNLLNLMNVDYVLLHCDFVTKNPHQEGYEVSRGFVNKWKDVVFVEKIGEVEVYRIEYQKNLGDIYLINSLVRLDESNSIVDNIVSDNYVIDKGFFNESLEINDLKSGSELPSLVYEKLSATNYRVVVRKANGPFVLVLANNYNDLWEAKISDRRSDRHFMINGFANAWIIDKKGDYDINIVFKIWPWD